MKILRLAASGMAASAMAIAIFLAMESLTISNKTASELLPWIGRCLDCGWARSPCRPYGCWPVTIADSGISPTASEKLRRQKEELRKTFLVSLSLQRPAYSSQQALSCDTIAAIGSDCCFDNESNLQCRER